MLKLNMNFDTTLIIMAKCETFAQASIMVKVPLPPSAETLSLNQMGRAEEEANERLSNIRKQRFI